MSALVVESALVQRNKCLKGKDALDEWKRTEEKKKRKMGKGGGKSTANGDDDEASYTHVGKFGVLGD